MRYILASLKSLLIMIRFVKQLVKLSLNFFINILNINKMIFRNSLFLFLSQTYKVLYNYNI